MSLKLVVTLLLVSFCLVEAKGNGKTRGSRGKHNWGNLNDNQIASFKKSLRRTNVERFVAALDRMNEAKGKKLQMTDAEKANMLERMKQIRNHKRSPSLQKEGDHLEEINENAGIAGSLYGGDMALTDEQTDAILGEFVDDSDLGVEARKKRQAYYGQSYPSNIWGSSFYYFFDPSLTAEAKSVALLAMAFWNNSTCINFVESTTAPNRVRFFKGVGCYSYVGMIGGVQDLSLGDGCQHFRQAAHEIAHALGYFHEQSRHDRDLAVTVNAANINPDFLYSYDKETSPENNNYGLPYDYGSIMQYHDQSFSSNGGKTMIATRPVYQDTMGSQSISFYDISMMNQHYQCKQRCTTGVTCLNGGFRNSRNCNYCICPTGYGGSTCADRTPGCGATLTATSVLQTETLTIGSTNTTVHTTFQTCNYLIKAPVGYKIEITLNALTNPQCTAGCIYKSIEVKAINDHRYTGMRYCCADDVGTKIVTEGYIAPVIIYNRYYQSQYSFTYRYVAAATPSTVQNSQIQFTKPTYGTIPPTACVDGVNCPTFVQAGFCTTTFYSTEQKKEYCPVSCNLC